MTYSLHRKLIILAVISIIVVFLMTGKHTMHRLNAENVKINSLKQLVFDNNSLSFEEITDREYQADKQIPADLTPFFFEKIPLCRAGEELLCTIPGVGPSTAAAIKRYVDQNGAPATYSALEEINGIGARKIVLLKTRVSLCHDE